MKALIQRTKKAKVETMGKAVGEIGSGLLVLIGISGKDTDADIKYLVDKIVNLRIFADSEDKMNLSLSDIKGDVLIISQFTLYANCKKGRRPSFINAAAPAFAEEMYKKFVQAFRATGLKVETGEFGAMMDVSLVNSGPVTIMLETDTMG